VTLAKAHESLVPYLCFFHEQEDAQHLLLTNGALHFLFSLTIFCISNVHIFYLKRCIGKLEITNFECAQQCQ